MYTTRDFRPLILRTSFALMMMGLALVAAPMLVGPAYASDGDVTCTATCRGGSCTGDKPYCVCTCHWFWGTPVCNCTEPIDQQAVGSGTPTGS